MTHYKWFETFTLIAAISPTLLAETHCPGNVASVPLRNVNRYQMIVQVTANHSGPYEFLLDTGTQATIIDPSLAAELHLSSVGLVTVAGVGFHEPASLVRLDTLAVGHHSVSDQTILVSDLSRMKAVGLNIQGILGQDFLENFDILIDNSHRMLCLDDAHAMRSGLKGTRVPLLPTQTPGSTPTVKSLVLNIHFVRGKGTVRLMLDSGANTPFLYKPSVCLEIGVIEGASWHGRGANGEQQGFVALPPQDLTINGMEMPQVQFLALRNARKEPTNYSLPYDGLLPTGLFSRVFLSQSGEFAVLEPK